MKSCKANAGLELLLCQAILAGDMYYLETSFMYFLLTGLAVVETALSLASFPAGRLRRDCQRILPLWVCEGQILPFAAEDGNAGAHSLSLNREYVDYAHESFSVIFRYGDRCFLPANSINAT